MLKAPHCIFCDPFLYLFVSSDPPLLEFAQSFCNTQDTLRRERDAAIASMNLSLAHCAAMLGRWVTCTRSLKCAQDRLDGRV